MTTAPQRLRRRFDRRLYRAFVTVARTLLRPAPWRGPLDPRSVHRILVVRHDRVGDLVVSTPMLSYLRELAPHAEIDVLASAGNVSLLDGDDRVAQSFVAPDELLDWRDLRHRLRARRYDVILSPIFGQAPREGVIAALAAHPHTTRVSVMRPKRYAGLFSTMARPPRSARHMAEHLLVLAHHAFVGGTARPAALLERYPMRLATRPESELRADVLLGAWERGRPSPLLVANLWAAESWREWPVDRLVELVRLLRVTERQLRLLLVPPPGREEAARAVAAMCGDAVFVSTPTLHLGDLVSLVRRADAVLTPDTAVVHIAAACRRPVVALYSSRTVRIGLWQPIGVPFRSITASGRNPVSTIPAAPVAEAVESLLSSSSTRRPR